MPRCRSHRRTAQAGGRGSGASAAATRMKSLPRPCAFANLIGAAWIARAARAPGRSRPSARPDRRSRQAPSARPRRTCGTAPGRWPETPRAPRRARAETGAARAAPGSRRAGASSSPRPGCGRSRSCPPRTGTARARPDRRPSRPRDRRQPARSCVRRAEDPARRGGREEHRVRGEERRQHDRLHRAGRQARAGAGEALALVRADQDALVAGDHERRPGPLDAMDGGAEESGGLEAIAAVTRAQESGSGAREDGRVRLRRSARAAPRGCRPCRLASPRCLRNRWTRRARRRRPRSRS